ncbi:protein phosphatase 2C domain-containing protein [Streptomyces sp. NBC_01775]|uniref:PP2C family protein-serine/threonine phosphatase n=1 Tax=Streptomyces sp. NBC_01775 TaxID=2975939 RepID=UPI002DD886C0|nr:protein phosphatase 2C domain-containing protein [Streptomyces sp. NBC_01775]WSB74748.1 protein phosphatase 2C domain-containing protein [Streptomyces sp. NBC_01775]
MSTHASHQTIGTRSHQCDATATYTHNHVRAYALLDGIGSSNEIRGWTRTMARRLARAAATLADAEAGLTRTYAQAAAEEGRGNPYNDLPSAVAVVAVARPGHRLTVAWCGDSRAYLLVDGKAERLTVDHNMRQVLLDRGQAAGVYSRNQVTSWLGNTSVVPELGEQPLIGAVSRPMSGRLLLASDGAYEPLEDSCLDVADFLDGTPGLAARTVVREANDRAPAHADNATVLVADLTD